MKTKSIATLLFSIILLTNVFAQDNYTKLQQKVDSLEIQLKKVCDSHPYAMGDTLNWANGLFIGGKAGTNYSMNLEVGYMFKTGSNPGMSLGDDYIGKRKDYRWGFSAGMQYFSNEPVFKSDVTFYKSTGYGTYGKFNFGSPVLLNFISFSCHLKAMYTVPTKDNDHKIRDNRMVYGYGYDIDFWVTETECATLGYTDESDSFFGGHEDDPIYPSKIRFVFGLKMFF